MDSTKVTIATILVSLFVLTFPVENSNARRLYVHQESENASDSYSSEDNSEIHPWKTIESALKKACPDDEIIIKGGPYRGQKNLSPQRSGSEGKPIKIVGHDQRVLIEGVSSSELNPIFNLRHRAYIVINNLDLRYGGIVTIRIAGSRNIEISNCTLSGINHRSNDNPCSIYISGAEDVLIANNEIHGNVSGHGIVMFVSKNIKIDKNHIHHLEMKSGAMKGSVQAIVAKHLCQEGIEITNNWIHDINSCLLLNMNNSRVENNLIYGIDSYGIVGNRGMGLCKTQAFMRNTIEHNTVVARQTGIYLANPADNCGLLSGARQNTVTNNIIVTSGSRTDCMQRPILLWPYNVGRGHDTTIDYNLYYHTKSYEIATEYNERYTMEYWKEHMSPQEKHSVNGDPLFENNSGELKQIKDFILNNDSMAKNAASDGKNMGADVMELIHIFGRIRLHKVQGLKIIEN